MLNLTRSLDFHIALRPGAEALVYDDVRLDWSALQDRVRRTAAGLKAAGVGPDTIVALYMKNSAAFIELLYAISHVGGVALPINYRLSGEEVDYIATHAGATLILADEEFGTVFSGRDLPVRFLDRAAQSDSTRIFEACGSCVKAAPRHGADLFRLMYTSGTTDRPKGVTQTYDNFYWKSADHNVALDLGLQDRLLVVGPLYHVGACDIPGLGIHLCGGTMVILRDFDAEATFRAIEEERITGIWLAPVMTSTMLSTPTSHDTATLRWCIGGGEKTPEHRIRSFSEVFPNGRYVDAYGMTETVGGDTFMVAGREIDKIGSVGVPVPHLELQIRDEDGALLPAMAEGEICMRGPKVTSGYWKDPEKTAAAFFDDGFFRSGDVGYMDPDGYLFLTDRKKDLIISGGENVASSEVERVLYTLDGVFEAAVVAREDEKWGEVPVAVIVTEPGAAVTFDDMMRHCRKHLAGFKCPKDLVVVESLPRNPSGKILKRVLRETVAAATRRG